MKDKGLKVCGWQVRMSPEAVGQAARGRYAGCGIAMVESSPWGLVPWEVKPTVVIYCDNHV